MRGAGAKKRGENALKCILNITSPLPAVLITSYIPWEWVQCVFIQRCNKYWCERSHLWSHNLYSLQQRPGRRTRIRHFSFTIHSKMEKFPHDVCGCATPPTPSPEQPSWSVCSASRWEHTWTASQPNTAFLQIDNTPAIVIVRDGEMMQCRATQHTCAYLQAARYKGLHRAAGKVDKSSAGRQIWTARLWAVC